MKKISTFLVLITFLMSQTVMAECNPKTDINRNTNGSYTYTAGCHVQTGKWKKEAELRKEQVTKLSKTIELKDLAIDTHQKRADLWMNTTIKLEDRVNTIERVNSLNRWLYFGLGIALTSLAVFGAGSLR